MTRAEALIPLILAIIFSSAVTLIGIVHIKEKEKQKFFIANGYCQYMAAGNTAPIWQKCRN